MKTQSLFRQSMFTMLLTVVVALGAGRAGAALDVYRQPDLSVWRSVTGDNVYSGNLDVGWRGTTMNVDIFNRLNLSGILNVQPVFVDPSVRTRSALTVGSVQFKARFEGTEGVGTLIVEKSMSSNPNLSHTLVEQVSVTNEWKDYSIDVYSYTPAYYRIRRPSGFNADNVLIRDIVITEPFVAVSDATIDGVAAETGVVIYDLQAPPTVAVTATGYPAAVWVTFAYEGGTSRVVMAHQGGNAYSVTMPVMGLGTVAYKIHGGTAFDPNSDDTSQAATPGTYTYVNSGPVMKDATINGIAAETGVVIYDLQAPPTLAVAVTGHVAAVWVTFTYDEVTSRLAMADLGGNTYSVTMPVMGLGTVAYKIHGGTAFDPNSDDNSEAVTPGTYTYVNSGPVMSDAKINGIAAGTGVVILDLETPPTITVKVTGHVAAAWVTFTYKEVTSRLAMADLGGNVYSVTMPVLGVGTVAYKIHGGTAFDPNSDDNSETVTPGTYTYVNSGPVMSNVTINGAPAGTGTAITDLKTPPTIAAAVSGNPAAVWVTFTYKGATWRLAMADQGGQTYSVTMPIMGAGTVAYKIHGGTAFDPYSDDNSEGVTPGTYTYVNSETLSVQRQPDLAVWRSVTGDTVFSGNLDPDWRATVINVNFDKTVSLPGVLDAQQEFIDPSVRTRSALKVGSIWFKARFLGGAGDGTLFIEKSLSSNPNVSHTLVEQVSVPYTGNWKQYRIDVDSDTAAYYRIRHPSGYTENDILIKDIVITEPTPEVALFKNEVDYSPGYPSRIDPVTFTVWAMNVYVGTPAENISPKLVWRLNKSPWTTTPMVPIGDNQYRVTLPAMDPGDFEYYYRADFTGYSYTGPFYPTGGNPADNIGDFSLWLDSNNNISESKGPAYYPDFVNSQLYDLSVLPPVGIHNGEALQDPFDYLSFNVRRFRSMHDTMTLAFAPFDGSNLNVNPTYTMEQVGDYTWHAVINLTNAIDVLTTVDGTFRYFLGDTEFDPSVKEWTAGYQDDLSINPPMSGFAVDDGSGTGPIRIQMDYDGFMMFRFLSTNGYYEVRRAAWQDFNSWQADNEQFTSSFGLFETDVYESDLTGKDATVMPAALIPRFEVGTTVSEDIIISDYINGLKVDRGWLIEESSRVVVDSVNRFNRAIKLAASPQLRGSIETTSASATAGRDTLRMRVRASMDDNNHAIYMRGFDFQNYTIVANTVTTSISDGDASVSLIGYYQSESDYIEARVTQRRDTSNRTYFELAIYQMKGGVFSILKEGTSSIYKIESDWPSLLANSGQWRFELQFPSSGAAKLSVFNSAGNQVGTTLTRNFTINANAIEMGGTVGVNSRDAVTKFKVHVTAESGSSGLLSAVASSPQTHWYLGGTMAVTGAPRWTFVRGASQNNPVELQRVVPTVTYRVSVFRTGLKDDDVIAPVPPYGQGWDESWDATGTGDEEKSVNTFAYRDVEIPMHLWDNVFIKIAPTGSDGFLVVDDVAVDAWRGETLYDPDWSGEDRDPDEELIWKATYAVITDRDNRGDMAYELARSRANTNANQMVVSPLLNEGIGDILFNYMVTQGNVSFVVESLRQNGQVHQMLMSTNVFAAPTPTMNRMYVSALTNITGRLRVRINNAESSSDGVLLIDNLKATNYPDAGDLSWEAYNMLISTFDTNPAIKFDGAANVDFRSAVLNNSETEDTPLNVSYDKDAPYLQSPKIETGIGEVSFWYRVYPVPSVGAGKIYLKAAKTLEGNPEWITLGVADLNPDAATYADQVADLGGLTQVTTEAWTYFSVEFYKSEYKFFRIYGEIDNGSRVMIDNVIVTEPVRTSIDIGSVKLIPDIPLYMDRVGVQVDLINPRMNPENIKVYLMWKIGTSLWGRTNWEGNPSGSVLLTEDPQQKYRYSVTRAIPAGNIDDVVQYSVKVVYTGTFAEPVYYGAGDFTNPFWYEPIDLNKQFSGSGHSPYFYRFSVGTNVVFINEFLPYGYSTFWGYQGLGEQYVELIGPDTGNIADWKLEHIDVPASSEEEDVVKWTNVFKSQAKFTARFKSGSLEPQDKGWGFYTLACGQVNETNPNFGTTGPIFIDEVLFPASLYTPEYKGFAPGTNQVALGVPGAMCLKRSMGAYVDRIAWGSSVDVGKLVERGYTKLVERGSGSSHYRKVYMLTDDGVNPGLNWDLGRTTADYSPGYFNPAEADLIWTLEADEEPPTPPEVAVQVTSIDVGATQATIQFSVASINGVALTAGDGFTWYAEASADVAFSNPVAYEIISVITAPDSGVESHYAVEITLDVPVADAQFYRIKAVHP